MVDTTAAHVLASGFSFLEGPRWHAGALWVSDMRAGSVLRIAASGSGTPVVKVDGWPSGLGFLPDGALLVVSMHEKRLYRAGEKGALVLHADLSDLVHAPLNDMVVAPDGRAYVGDIGFDFYKGEASAPGGITLVRESGEPRRVADGLLCPNGMVLRPGCRTLCVAESFGHRVLEFHVADDGGLTGQRVLVDLPGEVPDGICLDAAGGLWVACYQGKRFAHVNRDGVVDAQVTVGDRSPVACALGGEDGRTLFCLTYSAGLEAMVAGVPAAQIEVAQVAIPAAPDA